MKRREFTKLKTISSIIPNPLIVKFVYSCLHYLSLVFYQEKILNTCYNFLLYAWIWE